MRGGPPILQSWKLLHAAWILPGTNVLDAVRGRAISGTAPRALGAVRGHINRSPTRCGLTAGKPCKSLVLWRFLCRGRLPIPLFRCSTPARRRDRDLGLWDTAVFGVASTVDMSV